MKFENEYLSDLFVPGPYSIPPSKKAPLLLKAILREQFFHYSNNKLFRKFSDNKQFVIEKCPSLEDVPYIPAGVFKSLGTSLSSVDGSEIVTTLRSSATSGIPSSVTIDRETARRQVKALGKVLSDRLGRQRRPFLILDLNPASADADGEGNGPGRWD